MSICCIAARAGRPKDSLKRNAILAAARHLFSRFSYDGVTMEKVAAQACVSKMTVYSHFNDKESLFETMISMIADELLIGMTTPMEGGLSERLTHIGYKLLQKMTDPEIAGMMAMVPVSLRHNQALARRFYGAGPGRTHTQLAEIVLTATKSGKLAVADGKQASEHLIGLWTGAVCAEMAFGVITENVSDEDIKERARRGTEVFLRAYGTTR